MHRRVRCPARVDLYQGHDRKKRQRDDLDRQQDPLRGRRELDPDVTDPGHHGDPDRGDDADREERVRGAVPVEQQEGVLAGDVGERRHHDDVRDDDRPAGDPARARPHRARHPGEARAAVRVGPVHVVVGRRDQEHRDERDDHHGGRVHAHAVDRDDESQRGGEAVGRRHRGDRDDEVRQVADGVGLEALAAGLGSCGCGCRCALHGYPLPRCWRLPTLSDGDAGYSPSCCGRIADIRSARRCWMTVRPMTIRVAVNRIVATAFTSTGIPRWAAPKM